MARSLAGAAPGRTNRRFLILAIAFAGLSAGLIYAWMASNGSGGGDSTPAAGSQQVVVAKQPIGPRTAITAEMLELKNIPVNAIVDGGYTTLEDVVGKVTRLPLEANQQVTAATVVNTAAPTTEALANIVPTGRRGFSITASQVLTAGGLVLPGDYVDVVWICCEQGLRWRAANDETESQDDDGTIYFARTIVQNVQVVAVAQAIVEAGPVGTGDDPNGGQNPVASGTGDENPEAATITLLVTPEQAHILFMAEKTGTLRAALRGIDDNDAVPSGEDYDFTTPGLIPPELLQQLRDTFGGNAQ